MVDQDQKKLYTEMTLDKVKEVTINCSFKASLVVKKIKKAD